MSRTVDSIDLIPQQQISKRPVQEQNNREKQSKSKTIKVVNLEDKTFEYTSNGDCQHQKDPSKIEYYLASGHIELFVFKGDKLYKKAKKKQVEFYSNNDFEKQFNPKLYEIIGQKEIVIENLLYGLKTPKVMDIKLGKYCPKFKPEIFKNKNQEQKILHANQTGFRIAGYATPEVKQHSLLIKDSQVNRWILSKVVGQRNKIAVLEFLQKLLKEVKNHNRVYQATSLLIVTDQDQTRLKWIDFSYWQDSDHPDYGLIEGLSQLIKLTESLY